MIQAQLKFLTFHKSITASNKQKQQQGSQETLHPVVECLITRIPPSLYEKQYLRDSTLLFDFSNYSNPKINSISNNNIGLFGLKISHISDFFFPFCDRTAYKNRNSSKNRNSKENEVDLMMIYESLSFHIDHLLYNWFIITY